MTIKKIAILCAIVIIVLFLYSLKEYVSFSKTYSGNTINTINQQKTILLIIDVQNDLTKPHGKVPVDLKQANQIIENINMLVDKLKDSDTDIVYLKHEYKSLFFKLLLKNALAENSHGSEFDKRLHIANNNVFIKNVMDPFSNKEFQHFLNTKKVGHLIITGIDASYCIDKTVTSALQKKYKITIISDGIAGKTDLVRIAKVKDFYKKGTKILTAKEFLDFYKKAYND